MIRAMLVAIALAVSAAPMLAAGADAPTAVPADGLAGPDVDASAQAPWVSVVEDPDLGKHGLFCGLGHVVLLCPFQCDDGIDNDGDGLVDSSGDPGCTGWADDSEDSDPCTPLTRHAYAGLSGGGYDTLVDVEGTWDTGWACPTAPDWIGETGACIPGVGWVVKSCWWSLYTPTERGLSGLFYCADLGICGGLESPHVIEAFVTNAGSGVLCGGSVPASATAYLVSHCEMH